MELFDFPQIKIEKPIRLIELFAGVGSQAMALRDIGADFETWFVCEFDKYAIASYNAIHGTNFETMDIRDVHGADLGIVDKDKYTYLLTYSFPCTDLSVAGKMQGMSKADWAEGKSTRSGLLWEVERLLRELPREQLPDILLMENVPQVHSEQNKDDFDRWVGFLRSKGYVNHWKDLNARDFGIPQNRERCFMVSVLSDKFIDFEFPKPIKLDRVMKDFLESEVDERYYINNEKAEKLIEQLVENGTLKDNKRCVDLCLKNPREIDVANCIKARYDCGISNLQADGSGVIEIVKTNGKDFIEKNNVAVTLSARDSKGFSESFQSMNGVIECQTES